MTLEWCSEAALAVTTGIEFCPGNGSSEKGRVDVADSNAGTAAGSGAIYGLGIFGAWVYFWQQADGFWEYVWAVFQGIFWPAFMVFEAFSALD